MARHLAAGCRSIALATSFAIAAASCAPAGAPPRDASRLVVAVGQEPNSLNPLLIEGPSVSLVEPLIYSQLLTVDDAGRLRPELAERVPSLANGDVSRDGLTITYRLRPGTRWQDGVPLDAADVAFSFSAIMNPRNNVASRNGYDDVRRVEAVGARVVRVHLRRPYAPILGLFFAPDQNYAVLPRHLLERYRDLNDVPFNVMPIGSGPYRVLSWARGDRLRLVRNASYFGGAPKIAEIDLRFVPDASATLSQLRTGEAGAAFLADPSLLSSYETIAADVVARVPQAGFGDLLFNTRAPDVGDERVRRAVLASLDVTRIVRDATRGAQTARDAGRGLFSWAYDPAARYPNYDPAAAQRLFADAGWRRGADGMLRKAGRPLALDLAFPAGTGVAGGIAVAVQQQLRDAGIALTLRSYTPAFFRAPASEGGPLFGGRFALAFFEVFGDMDPDTHWYLGCDELTPHGFNAQRFCDPALDAMQARGSSTYDIAARRRAYAIVQRRVAEAVPFEPLYQTRAVNVYRRDLRGVSASPLSPFWNVARWSFAR